MSTRKQPPRDGRSRTSADNGAKGGRPRIVHPGCTWTKHGRFINARLRRGWSIRDIAAALEVAPKTVYCWRES